MVSFDSPFRRSHFTLRLHVPMFLLSVLCVLAGHPHARTKPRTTLLDVIFHCRVLALLPVSHVEYCQRDGVISVGRSHPAPQNIQSPS